jgi:AraC-like DNA-binding protein
MLFRSYVPRTPLCHYVNDFWLYENYENGHDRELILPSGTFEMVFNLQEDELRIYDPVDPNRCRRYAGALVSGPYAGSFMSDAADERAILGVHFKPGGAVAILGIPAREFRDRHVNLRDIWGPPATTLHERLCALNDPLDRFRFLELALLQHLLPPPNGHAGVRSALDAFFGSHGQARTRDLASGAGLSQRRFIELFAGEVGLTPKLFGRVLRFQHALHRSQDEMSIDWAQLAVTCGYFDQSHLIRDFTALASVSPAEYRRRRITLSAPASTPSAFTCQRQSSQLFPRRRRLARLTISTNGKLTALRLRFWRICLRPGAQIQRPEEAEERALWVR